MHYEEKKKTGIMDAETKLQHFAIISFYIDPLVIRPLIHNRFDLNLITTESGEEKALLSVVPFMDKEFYMKVVPFWKHNFGQTNYRVYVRDRVTGEDVVWFLGTTLDSVWNIIPRSLWKLPWHRGKITFDCEYDMEHGKYRMYKCTTESEWAENVFELEDSGEQPEKIEGFITVEKGMYFLSHPLKGYYYRKNGQIGSYQVWHEKLELSSGKLTKGTFSLLDRLNLWSGDLNDVHSVLIMPKTEFTIYLPPKIVSSAS